MQESKKYSDDLRLTRSLLIVTSLQKKSDIKALNIIKKYGPELPWKPLTALLIESSIWDYVVEKNKYHPQLIFCHPDLIAAYPKTILYYRGLCGLSLKACKDYFGNIESLEAGKGVLKPEKALKISRTFNALICSIIKNSTKWTLSNGHRTIIATLGITIDGIVRNNIGAMAETRIRNMIVEWLVANDLIKSPSVSVDAEITEIPNTILLKNGITMKFSSEPDIAFFDSDGLLLAVVEIKGGIDPAGALERYGAAKKSFESAKAKNPHCKNFYLGAIFTAELERRVGIDPLIEKKYDIIEIIEKDTARDDFLRELFHHTLRII